MRSDSDRQDQGCWECNVRVDSTIHPCIPVDMTTGLLHTGRANQLQRVRELRTLSCRSRCALRPAATRCKLCHKLLARHGDGQACCGRAGMQIRKRSSRESTYTQSLVLKRSVVLYCQAVGVHCETTTGGCIHSDAIASTGRRRSCTLAVVAIIASSVLDLCAGSCSATCVVCSRAKHCRGCLA